MSPQEAAQLLAAFASAYHRTVDESEARLWYQSTLHRIDYQTALKIADRIVTEDKYFPTPARFGEMRRAVERDMEQPYKALPMPAPLEAERERVAALIAKTRSGLRAKRETKDTPE